MRATDNRYSRIIGWARVLLPLTAVMLLATLFLFARPPADPARAPQTQLAAATRGPGVTAPQFSGITETGARVMIAARSATPVRDGSDAVQLEQLRLQVEHPGSTTLDATAATGALNAAARRLDLSGLVRIDTSDGYQMETNGLTIALDTGLIVSNGQLEIRAPFGVLTAGQVTFGADRANVASQILFTDGVELIYRPSANR